MRNMMSKLALAAAGLIGVVSSAQAGFSILTLRWGGGALQSMTCDSSAFAACAAEVTATGSGGAFTTSTVLGIETLRFFGTLGGTTAANSYFLIDTNAKTNSPGTVLVGEALAASTAITRLGAATDLGGAFGAVAQLTVDFISYGYTNPNGVDKLLHGTAAENTTGAGSSFNGALDKVNTFFKVDSLGGTAFLGGPFETTTSCNMSVLASNNCVAPTVPWTDAVAGYSLRAQQTYLLAAGSNWNASAGIAVTNVPEPTTTALVGIALLGMGAVARRRASKKA